LRWFKAALQALWAAARLARAGCQALLFDEKPAQQPCQAGIGLWLIGSRL
jgi:hypothetical protein